MSTFEVNPPYITGAPGLMICTNVMPASASAFCWASAPASVIGAIAPASVNGVTTIGWLCCGELDHALRHRDVEAQRRVGVDDRDDRRLAVERGLVDAAGDAHHLQQSRLRCRPRL